MKLSDFFGFFRRFKMLTTRAGGKVNIISFRNDLIVLLLFQLQATSWELLKI